MSSLWENAFDRNTLPNKSLSSNWFVSNEMCMRKIYFILLHFLLASFAYPCLAQNEAIPTPEKFFGFMPGSDRNVFDYEKLLEYYQKLEETSDRIKMFPIGLSSMGKPMYVVCISSSANIKNLDALKAINKRLALDPDIPEGQLQSLIKNGKVFVMATLSMHAGEVGPAQASPLIAYDLATTRDPEKLAWLENIVYMIVPTHNPDGMDMVVSNYNKYKGTKYEGAELPAVFNKYAGHDNNRDYISLTQQETKAVSAAYSREWYPQVLIDKHQMGTSGVRYSVPPPADPVSENIFEELWNWQWIFGSAMAKDMLNAGLTGVAQHYMFDDYWPGSTETSEWKNVISMLTECASAKIATPVYIEPNELRVGGKGLGDYKQSVNMTDPWPGGWWKLSDIVRYETVSAMSLLKTAFFHKEEILSLRNLACRKEVELGKTTPPYYYILPLKQTDQGELVQLVNLLDQHGIDQYSLKYDTIIEGKSFHRGDIVNPLAQPYRAFIKETMEKQTYPARHYTPGGELIRPYDVASWSLPLHKGLVCYELALTKAINQSVVKVSMPYSLNRNIDKSAGRFCLTSANNDSYRLAFLLSAAGFKVRRFTSPVVIKGETLPAGTLLVDNDHSDKLFTILQTALVTPVAAEEDTAVISKELKIPRIALVETNFHDMDAGWARFVFDTYSIPFTVLKPADISRSRLTDKFDCLVFPDDEKSILMDGKEKEGNELVLSDLPPEYTKGMGKDGLDAVLSFLDKGGKIISWGESVSLFLGLQSIKLSDNEKDEFQLPVKDASDNLKKDGLYCPGSLLRVNLVEDSPLTWGMGRKSCIFYQGGPVFSTSQPLFDTDRRAIAVFPENKILISGYCEKEEKLADRTVMVWARKGKGQLVLYGFSPVFRASVPVTYKLLFNALLMP